MNEDDPSCWDGITLRSSLSGWAVEARDRLADAARAGAWPAVIASRRGHRHLSGPLTPVIRHPVPADRLAVLQRCLHELIRHRAGHLVDEQRLRLPEIEPLTEQHTPAGWFAVPGMYGGFRYRFHRSELVVESWSRVVGGSGQRHIIDSEGTHLVDEGFV